MEALVVAVRYLIAIGIGYMLKVLKILSPGDTKPLGSIILGLTLPAVIISTFSASVYDSWMLAALACGVVYTGSLTLVTYLMTRRMEPKRRALFLLHCSGLNSGNIAIPYLSSALPGALVYAGMFATGDSFFALGGNYAAACIVMKKESSSRIRTVLNAFRSSPPLFAYVGMALCLLLGIRLPKPFISFCGFIGEANTVLCMLFIGLSLNFSKGAVSLKDVGIILGFRMLSACVLAALTLVIFRSAPVMLRQAIAICVFSAIPNIELIFTQKLELDTATAGLCNTLSCILAIPMLSLAQIVTTALT